MLLHAWCTRREIITCQSSDKFSTYSVVKWPQCLKQNFSSLNQESVKGRSLPGGQRYFRIELQKNDFIYEIKTKDLQQVLQDYVFLYFFYVICFKSPVHKTGFEGRLRETFCLIQTIECFKYIESKTPWMGASFQFHWLSFSLLMIYQYITTTVEGDLQVNQKDI